MKLTFIPTRAPLLYDSALPNFKPPKSYEGAKVRVKVSIPDGTADYWKLLDKARIKAEAQYKGAQIYALPEFAPSKEAEDLAENITSDAQLVELYVASTIPEKLKEDEGKIVAYILHKLHKVKGVNVDRSRRIEFLRVQAKNWLSFKECDFKFRPGVLLVSGRNYDWNGGSNGSGKSNFLQFIRAALYGSTTKGQEHDALVHDSFPDDTARVSTTFRDGNAIVKALRRRNPSECHLFVDGRDVSSGNRRTAAVDATENFICRRVGMTREMFDHSVLIDQKLVNTTATFLSGTDKQKKALLDEFMGTERFLEAGKIAHHEVSKCACEIELYEESLTIAHQNESIVRDTIVQLTMDTRTNLLRDELHEVKGNVVKEAGMPWLDMKEELITLQTGCDDIGVQSEKSAKEVTKLAYDVEKMKCQRAELNALEATCPTCYQVIDETVRKRVNQDFDKQIKVLVLRLKEATNVNESLDVKFEKAIKTASKKQSELEEKAQEYEKLQQRQKDLQSLIDQAPTTKMIAKLERRMAKHRRQQKVFASGIKSAQHRFERLVYCEKALSREGLVNYLYAQLCTKLNKAAEHYSELLCDGIISLRFIPYVTRKNGTVVNEFDVQIANVQGGKARKDQSRGEEQIACLICILALREVGPDCNLLILDEPAEGLEPANAARLAEGIERLTARFSTILLASHNESIRSRFASGLGITIEKRNKISRIVEV